MQNFKKLWPEDLQNKLTVTKNPLFAFGGRRRNNKVVSNAHVCHICNNQSEDNRFLCWQELKTVAAEVLEQYKSANARQKRKMFGRWAVSNNSSISR